MKKGKRVGNRTDSNFFTSQFKLTSTEFPKHHRQKKMFSTFTQLKQAGFDEESKKTKINLSKDGKPIIQQLRLLTSTKEDDFRLPKSNSKRSMGKNPDLSREKKASVTEIFETFYEETRIVEQKKRSMGYMEYALAQRKFKPLSVKHLMKDKLEKTALQRFKDAISNENNSDQNQVSEKNAEALYLLLKSARKRQEQERTDFRLQKTTQLKQQSSKNPTQQKSQRSLGERQHMQLPSQEVNQKQNRTQFSSTQQAMGDKANERNSQQNFYRFAEQKKESNKSIQDMISRNTQQLLGKLKNNDPNEPNHTTKANVVLQFSQKQSFGSSSSEQSSDYQLQMESNILKKGSMNSKEARKDIEAKAIDQSRKNQKENPAKRETPKEVPPKEQFSQKRIIEEKTQQQAKKEVDLQRTKKQETHISSKQQVNTLDEIPSAKVITYSQKPPKKDQVRKQTKRQKQSSESTVKAASIPSPVQVARPLGAPPKLQAVQNSPKVNKNRIDYKSAEVDEDELQQICFGDKNKMIPKPENKVKPEEKTPSAVKAEVGVQPKVQSNQNATVPAAPVTLPEKKERQPEQPEEQSQFDPLDELDFFIERIEDVGQYRINSRDLYNDKSISKQLIESYKICSYYMAHQFLYLSKQGCQLFKSATISKDYYTITAEELNELKNEGHLEYVIESAQTNMEEAKKLLKKCYEESKPLLKKQEQILLLDGKANYHLKCCAALGKEFKLIYGLYQRKLQSESIQKRCCYLIELFSTLKLLNGEQIKDHEELQEIEDYGAHIKRYKNLLMPN